MPELNRIALPKWSTSLFLPIRYDEVFSNDTYNFIEMKLKVRRKEKLENYDTKIISYFSLSAYLL